MEMCRASGLTIPFARPGTTALSLYRDARNVRASTRSGATPPGIGFLVILLSLATYLMSLSVISDLVSEGLPLMAYLFGLIATLFIPGMMAGAIGRLRSQGIKPEGSKFG